MPRRRDLAVATLQPSNPPILQPTHPQPQNYVDVSPPEAGHDLMLLELEQDSTLPPIDLATSPTPSLADAGVSATVVGWGNTEDGSLHWDADGPGSTDAEGVCTGECASPNYDALSSEACSRTIKF